MTTYYVRAGGQGEGGTLPSIGAALRLAKPGDRVIVGGGIYREEVRLNTLITVEAAPGEPVVIDGGWDGRKNTQDFTSFQVGIGAGATLRGVVIRNCPGRGMYIGGGGDGATVEDVTIENCYNSGFVLNGMGDMVENVVLRRVTIRGVSRSWQIQPPAKRQGVGGNMLFRWGKNILLEDCVLSGGYGEGPAAGVGTTGFTMRGCVIDTTMHLLNYAANRARDVLIEGCIFYQTGDPEYRQPDGQVGGGIVVGDETRWDEKDDKWQHSENVTIRRCLIVNAGVLFSVRNNAKDVGKGDPDGYETPIQNLTIERCTFVAGPDTRGGILLAENPFGNRVKGMFSENVIYVKGLDKPFLYQTPGIKFTGNAWIGLPADQLPAEDYLVDASALVNPTAVIEQKAGATLNLDNYRPRPDGPLVVARRAVAGALEPVGEEPEHPPPPPPPPPLLMKRAAAVAEQLAVVHMAVEAALDELGKLIEAIAIE